MIWWRAMFVIVAGVSAAAAGGPFGIAGWLCCCAALFPAGRMT